MRAWKPLSAAIVVTFLLAMALSMVTISAPEESAPSTIDVPVGNLGDEATYALYDDDDELRYTRTYTIGALTDAMDARGVNRQTFELGIRYENSNDGFSHNSQQVALDDRFAIQEKWVSGEETDFHGTNAFLWQNAKLAGFHVQGEKLTLGESLDWPAGHKRPISLGGGYGRATANLCLDSDGCYYVGRNAGDASLGPAATSPPDSIKVNVSKMGVINGTRVVGVTVNQEIDSLRSYLDSIKSNSTFWFSEDSPYPLLVEWNNTYIRSNGEISSYGGTKALIEFNQGTEPIPWGGSPGAAEDSEKVSSGGLYPAEGEGEALPYPLEQAINDVMLAAGNSGWLKWKLNEPDAKLVSAGMHQGADSWLSEDLMEWRLVFKGDTDAYEVRTERHPDLPTPHVEGLGPVTIPSGDYSGSLEGVTIDTVVRMWNEYNEGDHETPKYFHWGVFPEEWRPAKTCFSSSWAGGGMGGAKTVENMLHTVWVGYATHGPCKTEGGPEIHFQAMGMNFTQPGLLADTEYLYDLSPEAQGSGDNADRNPPALSSALDQKRKIVVGAPDFERGATVAVPLLALIFTAYFYPVLQFAATKGFLCIPAFSRIKKSKVLDQKQRERIHTLVRENPGISPSDLKKQTGLGWGTVVHHLAVMEREDMVASTVQGRHRRFFVAEDVPPAQRSSLAVLANERTQELYTSLLDTPGLATPELAQRLGVTSPGAIWHLKRLEENGLVERKRDGKCIRYYPAAGFRPYDPREAVEVV